MKKGSAKDKRIFKKNVPRKMEIDVILYII
mgnify:CR=1 FL=1